MAVNPRRRLPPEPLVWLDGQFLREGEAFYSVAQLRDALQCGLQMEVVASATTLREFARYYERLLEHLRNAKLPIPPYISERALGEAIIKLLHRNRYFQRARITITATLSQEFEDIIGRVPTSSIMVSAIPVPEYTYTAPSKTYLHIHNRTLRHTDNWQGISWVGDPVTWYAKQHARDVLLGESLLLNQDLRIADSTCGTPYLILNAHTIITPPISEGVVYDPIREVLPHVAQHEGYRVLEQAIEIEDLEKAEAVFLLSSGLGIIPIKGILYRRYDTRKARDLLARLNQHYFPER